MDSSISNKKVVVEISWKTIVFSVVFLLGIYFFYLIRDLIFAVFIAFIFRSALLPVVQKLRRLGIPHIIASVLVFFVFLSAFIAFFAFVLPPLVVETTNFIRSVPQYLSVVFPGQDYSFDLNSSLNFLPNFTSGFFSVVSSVFSNIFFVIMTLFLSLYFIIQEHFIRDILVTFLGEKHIDTVVEVSLKIEKRLAQWLWGQLFLMLVIGVLTYIGLSFLNIKYALALAVLAGLLEVVPNVGPVLSLIPSFLIALSNSYLQAVSVVGLYFFIQQFENTLIVPLIMRKAVGLNPIVTLLALVIGGRLGGVLGIILSIPILISLQIILFEFISRRQ
ncbi:MAG: AI-2E family transporter [Patescibacteria group bacterium]|nr:MAG: AI-2E family transporter [Patescibacteria group bacterium]